MTKLTETQTIILSAGAQRPENIALPLPKGLAGAAAKMAVSKMIEHGWLQEVDANLRRGEPLWRETGESWFFGQAHVFIAGLFQLRFAKMAAIAGLFGAGAAAIMGAILRLAGGGQGLTPVLPITWLDLLAVLPAPLAAGAVAALAARLTAQAMIRDLA